ncbi:MAG: LolA family protein [Spirochaetia bacterium]
MHIYKHIIFGILLLMVSAAGFSQDITTAETYFSSIGDNYARIQDYRSQIVISQEDTRLSGILYYKHPSMLRLDFSEPEEQVLVSDGEKLYLYLPDYRVVMEQRLRQGDTADVAGMASREGLEILQENYSVAYVTGPSPVPLEEDSQEMVVKLRLTWRTTEEGFRQIDIAIGENGLIRRIEGVTIDYRQVRFDLLNTQTNIDIPDNRFEYELPSNANVFENFLFELDE